MQDTLIDQGISLMIFGMGTVFVFLTILVFATGLMSKLVHLLNKSTSLADNKAPTQQSDLSTQNVQQPDGDTLEAIKQAIKLHRQK